MKTLLLHLMSVLFLLSPVTGTLAGSTWKISIPVVLPGSFLTPEALAEIRDGCRKMELGESSLALQHFKKALSGVHSISLRKELQKATNQSSPDDIKETGTPEAVISPDPVFFLIPGEGRSPGQAMLVVLRDPSLSWMASYLKDPGWMRENLSERVPGLMAEIDDLPPILMTEMVTSSKPEDLSAWIFQPGIGGRILVFLNLIHAYCREYLVPESQRILPLQWSKNLDEKALEWLVTMHRLGHGMGPVVVQAGNTDKVVGVDEALGENYYILEEIKADALALLSGLQRNEKDKKFVVPSSHIIATYTIYLLARAFRKSIPEAKPFRIILNTLFHDGGLRYDLSSRRIIPDSLRMQAAMKSLLKKVIRLQAKGEKSEAAALIESMEGKSEAFDFPQSLVIKESPDIELVPAIVPGEAHE